MILLTAPAPTPNGPLHLGHLAGPFLSADIALRVARQSGRRVWSICGTDDHQNYARQGTGSDLEARERVVKNRSDIRRAFARLKIAFDDFPEPLTDTIYQAQVRDLFSSLVSSDCVRLDRYDLMYCTECRRTLHHAYVEGTCGGCTAPSAGGTCEDCGIFNDTATIVDPRCTNCGQPPEVTSDEVPLLDLERLRPALLTLWATSTHPPAVTGLLRKLLQAPLPCIPLAYPTDWGIPSSSSSKQRIDFAVELALGYARTVPVGNGLAPSLDTVLESWRDVEAIWSFFGTDNVYYYAIIFPAVLLALGIHLPAWNYVTNYFYELDGRKFSTSRNHAVWVNDLPADADWKLLRLYLAWSSPQHLTTGFSWSALDELRTFVEQQPQILNVHKELRGAELARLRHSTSLEGFDLAAAARSLTYLVNCLNDEPLVPDDGWSIWAAIGGLYDAAVTEATI